VNNYDLDGFNNIMDELERASYEKDADLGLANK
jgi:hypothetical protein